MRWGRINMAVYRFYILGSDSRIVNRADIECTDDADALVKAKALKPVHGIEIWLGARKVGANPDQE